MTRPLCAFCAEARTLTKEHIWPAGFLRRTNYGSRYSARANRTFAGDLTIKDVCSECNNGPLSRLDGYACELYDRYFHVLPRRGEIVTFEYNFGQLTRWLLKTAFNSARSNDNADADLLQPYAPCILSEYPCLPAFVGFFVTLVGPSLMMNEATGATKVIQPLAARSGPIVIPNVTGYDQVSIRMIMINGYFFSIAIFRRTTIDADAIADLVASIPGEPLALSGRMHLTTTMDAATVLRGVQDWPAMRS